MAQSGLAGPTPEPEGITQAEALAIAVTVTWMAVVGLAFWTYPVGGADPETTLRLRNILMLVAVLVPAFVVAMALFAARRNRQLREEIAELSGELDHLRLSFEAFKATEPAKPAPPAPALQLSPQKPDPSEALPASNFRTRREVSRIIVPRAAPQMPEDQPGLGLDGAEEPAGPPLDQIDLIKALNFPDDEHDTDGFAALRRALRDRTARRLVQASQDVLTLLSQDGIYMDDLTPDPIPYPLWQRFADGTRGKEVDLLGAIRDRDALARCHKRMREDTIFRDAVHHFLRWFDQMLITFVADAREIDLQQLAETRTARAFMLLSRAAGAFD